MAKKEESDSVIPLSRFRVELARPDAQDRVDTLLSGRDPGAAVAALAVPDFYFLLKEIGHDEGRDLLALATPEQVRGWMAATAGLAEPGEDPSLDTLLQRFDPADITREPTTWTGA